ncbi:hypothetical protein HK100_008739 [Physocladia obscura]|uniref:phosphoribosylglycinamide formyltransferase 1 n=1 Tax=Physocladia obscura TaxID=109957 RepID=A0AAD5TA03_9FUNG|nr:hypothetical protein HK100_008739 [Physocladia obscura]
MKTICVLISGSGTNLQALIDACANGTIPDTRIGLVVSNRSAAYGLERARIAGIATFTQTLKSHKDAGKTRADFDADLASSIRAEFAKNTNNAALDLIVLAGFMHILSPVFLAAFETTPIINLHPALPGQFDGANAIGRAYEAFQAGVVSETGVMVHRVIAEVDRGDVVLVERVPILASDTLESLEQRIHEVEHGIIVRGALAILTL